MKDNLKNIQILKKLQVGIMHMLKILQVMLYGLMLSLQFLTRIPLKWTFPWNSSTAKWALRTFPLVGLFIGACLILLVFLFYEYLPAAILAMLILTVWVWFTGGLHIDGLMDLADALGSNRSLQKKIEIMKDPHVGSFGMLALLFVLGWKFVLLLDMLHLSGSDEKLVGFFAGMSMSELDIFLIAMLVIPAFSRWGVLFLLNILPALQKKGLAWEWKRQLQSKDVLIALLPVLVIMIFFPIILSMLVGYLVFIGLVAYGLYRHFQGINGDMLGATIEGGEVFGLCLMWMYISFVML